MATQSKYWSLYKCDNARVPFNFIIGGRGTGKTYGTLSRCFEEAATGRYFMYLRRMESEIAGIANPRYNPFKRLNTDHEWNVEARYSQQLGIGEFYETVKDGKEKREIFYGYGAALSTFGKLRGADLSDVKNVCFDEFIKTKTAKPLKDEADLFFNAYETINRNRELIGEDPVVCYILSNSTTLNSPLLQELELIPVIEKMKREGQNAFTDRNKGVHIELLDNSAISQEKSNTALYKLTTGTTYYSHAIDNEFAYDSFENIKKVHLSEYLPYIQIGDLYIYKHKDRLEFYVTHSQAKCERRFTGDSKPLFRRMYGIQFYNLMLGGYVYYSSFAVKQEMLNIFPQT